MKGPTVSIVKDIGKPENTHSEVGNSVVDRLLLRYLSYRVSRAGYKKPVLAHLIVGNSLPKSFDESRHLSGICRLVHEPIRRAFRQQFL